MTEHPCLFCPTGRIRENHGAALFAHTTTYDHECPDCGKTHVYIPGRGTLVKTEDAPRYHLVVVEGLSRPVVIETEDPRIVVETKAFTYNECKRAFQLSGIAQDPAPEAIMFACGNQAFAWLETEHPQRHGQLVKPIPSNDPNIAGAFVAVAFYDPSQPAPSLRAPEPIADINLAPPPAEAKEAARREDAMREVAFGLGIDLPDNAKPVVLENTPEEGPNPFRAMMDKAVANKPEDVKVVRGVGKVET